MNTDKSSTHQHTVRGTPTTNTGVHAHTLTAVEKRLVALEAAMADVVLRITKVEANQPPPVPPPVEPTGGASFYIAPSGSDSSGAGTLASPWKSIAKFFASAPSAGDTLYCRGGSYASAPIARAGWVNDVQYPNLVGTPSAPITIRNYPGETPIFTSESSQAFIYLGAYNSWVVFDGLQIANSGGAFSIGGWGPDMVTYRTQHITFRRIKITQGTGEQYGHNHLIYFSGGSRYTTVEDSEFVGAVTGVPHIWHTGVHHYGGDGGYHLPASTNYVVQRNTFRNWADEANPGLVLWDDGNHTGTGSVLNNTFVGNTRDIRADRHGSITVQGNSTTLPNNDSWLYDPNDAAYTTASGNLFNQ